MAGKLKRAAEVEQVSFLVLLIRAVFTHTVVKIDICLEPPIIRDPKFDNVSKSGL